MKYSVLVKRVVNFRFDGVAAGWQTDAIRRVDELRFHDLIRRYRHTDVGRNLDGSRISLRYIDDGDESHAYLVDEPGDEDFSRSVWYASDGVTALDPGDICPQCMRSQSGNVGLSSGGVERTIGAVVLESLQLLGRSIAWLVSANRKKRKPDGTDSKTESSRPSW